MSELQPIARTLLIPFVGRACSAEFFPKLGFKDPMAERWMQKLAAETSMDFTPFRNDRLAAWGTIKRTLAFDQLAKQFLELYPQATVLNLGAGLCTRFSRIDNGSLLWIEVDVPQVLELRDRLDPPTARHRSVPFDLGNPDPWGWLNPVPQGPTLVIAEGLTMFLPPTTAEDLFSGFSRLASPARILFDYLHPWIITFPRLRPSSLRSTGAKLSWGVASTQHFRETHPGLLIHSMQGLTERHPWLLRILDQMWRKLLGAPLYDIAVADKSD